MPEQRTKGGTVFELSSVAQSTFSSFPPGQRLGPQDYERIGLLKFKQSRFSCLTSVLEK